MSYQNLFCLILLYLMASQFSSEVCANCVCKEEGSDYCSSCSGQRIIRPQLQQYQESKLHLPPIGDNCGCSKQLLEPASLPKVPCPKHNNPKCSCKLVTNVVNKFPAAVSSSSLDSLSTNFNYMPLVQSQDYSHLADPVSVSLAFQVDKAAKVPEAWTHGLVRKPVDQLKRVVYSKVPEEKLFGLNREVITSPKRPIGFSHPEHKYGEMESDIEKRKEIPQLTYQQLGYRVERNQEPQFRNVYTEQKMPIVQYTYDKGLAYTSTIPAKNCVACREISKRTYSRAH